MSTTATQIITADELLAMGDIGRCELIYGELIMMSPAGFDHGELALRFGRFLCAHVEARDLGVVVGVGTGFLIDTNPDLLCAPDASFVRKERVPKRRWKKYFPGFPDLAVEVLSPDDRKREVAEKVNMWLAHGTTSVWVADPDQNTVMVHHTGEKPLLFTSTEELRDDAILPGFVLPLKRIYRRP